MPPLRPLAAAVLQEHLAGFPVFVLPDNEAAERFTAELSWHLTAAGRPAGEIPILPALEVEPYRGISPHPRILAQRSLALWRLLDGTAGGLVVTPDAWLGRLPAPAEWIGRLVELRLAREFHHGVDTEGAEEVRGAITITITRTITINSTITITSTNESVAIP